MDGSTVYLAVQLRESLYACILYGSYVVVCMCAWSLRVPAVQLVCIKLQHGGGGRKERRGGEHKVGGEGVEREGSGGEGRGEGQRASWLPRFSWLLGVSRLGHTFGCPASCRVTCV